MLASIIVYAVGAEEGTYLTICLISFSNSHLITVLDRLIDMFSNESHDDLERIMMVENHHPHSIDPRR